MSSLKSVKAVFLNQIDESMKFVQKVNRASDRGNLYFSTKEFSLVYEISFVKIFTAWEKFIENSFIAYLQGNFTPKLKPRLITKKLKSEQAYDLLKGTKQYPDWTKVEDILLLASIFFVKSNPYDIILRVNSKELAQMKIIRNAITHISISSIDGFRKLIRSELTSFNSRMCPGEFLMQKKFPSEQYLSYYINMLKNAASIIVRT